MDLCSGSDRSAQEPKTRLSRRKLLSAHDDSFTDQTVDYKVLEIYGPSSCRFQNGVSNRGDWYFNGSDVIATCACNIRF